MTADPVTTAPQLTKLLKERIAKTPGLAEKIAKRKEEIGKRHAENRAKWTQTGRRSIGMQKPMTVPRLALEVWDAIKGEDWVLTTGDLGSWGKKLWNFDRPYCHAGRELGTGTQIGLSLGVALANKGTGRLVVDLQPDGDLMFDAGSLWIAAKYKIPMLVVMFNNRAYYNDWNHQLVLARTRGTDPNRAHIGMDLLRSRSGFRRTRAIDGLVRRRTVRKRRRPKSPRSNAPSSKSNKANPRSSTPSATARNHG